MTRTFIHGDYTVEYHMDGNEPYIEAVLENGADVWQRLSGRELREIEDAAFEDWQADREAMA